MSKERVFFVYLLASDVRGTLYVGVTSDLVKRVWEHKTKAVPDFTARYGVDRLVWFEAHGTAGAAITRANSSRQWVVVQFDCNSLYRLFIQPVFAR
jgi:putative endonuclease